MFGNPVEKMSLEFDILLEPQVSIREVLKLCNNTVIIKDLKVGAHEGNRLHSEFYPKNKRMKNIDADSRT